MRSDEVATIVPPSPFSSSWQPLVARPLGQRSHFVSKPQSPLLLWPDGQVPCHCPLKAEGVGRSVWRPSVQQELEELGRPKGCQKGRLKGWPREADARRSQHHWSPLVGLDSLAGLGKEQCAVAGGGAAAVVAVDAGSHGSGCTVAAAAAVSVLGLGTVVGVGDGTVVDSGDGTVVDFAAGTGVADVAAAVADPVEVAIYLVVAALGS
mmetsp:Transcript_67564/g.147127  ORF Transcript_67564/g.147127 Transcript_67564/m.147127 type:complete len:208 (-) Transcript_67564:282-905(-)